MNTKTPGNIRAAELVLPAKPMAATLAFFTERLGFRVDLIYPADDPAVAVISAGGTTLRLERDATVAPGMLQLHCADPELLGMGESSITAPNGTVVNLIDFHAPPDMPDNKPAFEVTHLGGGASWGEGRAGMHYRDLVPSRQGGRFIASHIRIEAGGPVPDYVHFHKIRFQMIYCYRGWVRVVYEDQGASFVLNAGDCVLQPPQIRHRVLESSPELEVVEIGCPAEHETRVDHDLELPTSTVAADRDFGGQRFVRHIASDAQWQPWREAGFEARDLGMEAATDGLAGVRVARPVRPGNASGYESARDAEFAFGFVLSGTAALVCEGQMESLAPGSAFTLPGGAAHSLADCSDDFEVLDITLPARI
jgi:quercetin dioxygenase-like cupin family protein